MTSGARTQRLAVAEFDDVAVGVLQRTAISHWIGKGLRLPGETVFGAATLGHRVDLRTAAQRETEMTEILARLVVRRAAQQQHEDVIAAALLGHPDGVIVRPLAMLVDHGQLAKITIERDRTLEILNVQ